MAPEPGAGAAAQQGISSGGQARRVPARPGLAPQPGGIGTWSSGPALPAELGEVACGVVGGELLVVGEGDPRTFAYDFQQRTWRSDLAQRAMPGNHHAAEVVAGRLYLFGGLGFGSEGRVQVYDPVMNQWREGAPMAWSGGSCLSAAIGGEIFVAGGIVGSTTVSNCAAYDPLTDSWSARAPMPAGKGRNHAAAGTDGQRLWVFGGRGPGSGDGNWVDVGFDTVQVYDPLLDQWTTSEQPGSGLTPLPQRRGGMGRAVWFGGEFYVLGGETLPQNGQPPLGVYDRVDVYHPPTDSWRREAALPTARHGIFPVLHQGRLWVAAGGDVYGLSATAVLEVFERP